MTKVWMIVSQGVMALSLLPWAMALMMSPMAFDSGVSTMALAFIGVLLCYPLSLMVCAFLSWRSLGKGNQLAANIWTSAPFILGALVFSRCKRA